MSDQASPKWPLRKRPVNVALDCSQDALPATWEHSMMKLRRPGAVQPVKFTPFIVLALDDNSDLLNSLR